MKRIWTLLAATLIFLAVPVLASAHDGRHDDGPRYYRGWSNRQHAQNHKHQTRLYRHDQRVKTRLRHELRDTRRELHHVRQQVRYDHRHAYYARPAVVIGVPNLVFRIDW